MFMDLMLDSLVTENMCKMSFRTFIQFVMVNNRIISLEKIVRMQQNKIAKLNQDLEDRSASMSSVAMIKHSAYTSSSMLVSGFSRISYAMEVSAALFANFCRINSKCCPWV